MSTLARNIGRRILRKKQKKIDRVTRVHNFKTAHSAIILFDTSRKNSLTVINKFKDFLESEEIECKVIGIVPEKEVPDEMTLRNRFEFITKKEISWYKRPKGDVAERFLNETPDILLDFTFNPSLEVQFLVKLSKASFKVGHYTEEDNDYDLMINPPGDPDLEYFAEQVKHYIHMLNPS